MHGSCAILGVFGSGPGSTLRGHRWSTGVAIECTAVHYLAIGNILEQHSARLEEADSEMAKNEPPKARTTGQGTMGKMKEDVGKNQTQDKDIVPLPWAAREGHLTLIKILLDHLTPKICITNRPQARLALHLALQGCNVGGPELSHSEVVKLLERKGAPVLDELYTALKDNNQAILRTLVDLDLLPGTTSREYSEFMARDIFARVVDSGQAHRAINLDAGARIQRS